MGKKHKKHLGKIDINVTAADRSGSICIGKSKLLCQSKAQSKRDVHEKMTLRLNNDAGIFFGDSSQKSHYIGMPQGTEGNIIVIGGNGSGKSAGIAMPTLRTWQGSICATDVKGELSETYKKLYQQGLATRPYIVFNPMDATAPSYDPFWWLAEDDEANLLSNIWEIATAVLPVQPNDYQPFWIETEQGIFAAGLLHYFNLGLSFSEAICQITEISVSSLCEELRESNNTQIKKLIGQTADMKEETLATVDRGLRNKLMLLAANPYIGHALRGTREGANCFSWNDLDNYNIFLCIPADRIEQWSGTINLMYTQLIRHLERRPEMHSAEGAHNVQALLLMDEFARFGKLETITSAMATLRSKNVNICLMVQSIAQLDRNYGEHDRRIIFDNCQYQAILRANDAKTQEYLSELVGTCIRRQHSVGEQLDAGMNIISYSRQISEVREWRVFPHEFSTLEDILLLTPYGFCRVKKHKPNHAIGMQIQQTPIFNATMLLARKEYPMAEGNGQTVMLDEIHFKINEGATITSVSERSKNASDRADSAKHQQRAEQREARERQKKTVQRRNYIIGELVSKYFPEVKKFEPGTKAENAERFQLLDAFLSVLAADWNLVEAIKAQARSKCAGAGCHE